MNPFDLRAALLAPHAQHPARVHFPIALLLAGVAFDWLAYWRGSVAWARAASANLFAAALCAPFTLISGLAAWQWQFEGAALKGNLRLHLLFATLSVLGIGALSIRRWRRLRRLGHVRPSAVAATRTDLVLGLVTAAVVILTGHLGGFVSGVNAAGANLP